MCDIDGFKERTFGNLKFVIGKSSWDLEFRHHDIELKLMEYFSKTENVQKLAEMRKVENDDDERIQPFTSSQIRALDAWSKSKSEALDKVLTYVGSKQNISSDCLSFCPHRIQTHPNAQSQRRIFGQNIHLRRPKKA